MLRIILLVSAFTICHAKDLSINVKWERNDRMLVTLDLIYENLAGPVQHDASNPQKRSFSLISEAILMSMALDKPVTDVSETFGSVLNEPADVIAADSRRNINLLRSIIDQPINDIKRACQPNTTSMNCVDVLYYHYSQQKQRCSLYDNHVNLRDMVEDLLLSQDFQNFLIGALRESTNGDDISALVYYIESVASYPEMFRTMKQVFEELRNRDYPCRIPGPYDEIIERQV